jgi:hypothetical protein
MWQMFSYRIIPTMLGPQYEGTIVFLIWTLIKYPTSFEALRVALFRTQLPNTLFSFEEANIFFVTIFFHLRRSTLTNVLFSHQAAGSSKAASQGKVAKSCAVDHISPLLLLFCRRFGKFGKSKRSGDI